MPPSLLLLRPVDLRAATAPISLPEPDRRNDVLLPTEPGTTARPHRRRLWEIAGSLHCSIIGTCLSNAELRRVFAKLGSTATETADEHDLHVRAVTAAGNRDGGSKFLHKALDDRHSVAIRHYAAARDEATLTQLWKDSSHRGDIPGGYWALLTHPHATEAAVTQAFREVHMLSHLLGAANRADIRRLRQLEQDNEALLNKLRRQETQLRDGFRGRDRTIAALQDMLARRGGDVMPAGSAGSAGRQDDPQHDVSADLEHRLRREQARRQRLEERLDALSATLQAARVDLRTAGRDRDGLARDLGIVEQEFVRLISPAPGQASGPCLAGDVILYVGGRIRHIPQIKVWVERAGGRFLHHDGGIEHSLSLLPGLISRADLPCFPVDCVSHDAVAIVKRQCRQARKPYVPLRTSSIAALISALTATPDTGASAAE